MPVFPHQEGGLITPLQAASGLMKAAFLALEFTGDDKLRETIPYSFLHFHDDSGAPIAWNDVQAIMFFNQVYNADLQVPLTATEGYNQHGHSSQYDGGWVPGRGIHDHRDNANGGFAFAVYHPGTSLPQQPFAL